MVRGMAGKYEKKEKGDGMTVAQSVKREVLEKKVSVVEVLEEVRVKDRLERKAFEALERRLEPQSKVCGSCKGEGERSNGDGCNRCGGNGYIIEEVDMRAIELVLSPKFPKTQISVTADLDGMDTESLLRLIEGI